MILFIALILMGAVNLAICDPGDPYTKDCEPPPGFNITTPTGLLYKFPIRPIEKCCPACDECVSIGGRCKIRWLPEIYPEWCDFTSIGECRDYSCTCCVKCSDDKCSPCIETGGECRKKCRSGELEDTRNVCSFYNKGTESCKCCKKCEATSKCTDAQGCCKTDPADCEHGTYASTGCCGGCYCCKPVLEPVVESVCATTGGCYCSDTDQCAPGYYSCFGECSKTLCNNGHKTRVDGYGCIPKVPQVACDHSGCAYQPPDQAKKISGHCLLGLNYDGLTNVGKQTCSGACNCWIEKKTIQGSCDNSGCAYQPPGQPKKISGGCLLGHDYDGLIDKGKQTCSGACNCWIINLDLECSPKNTCTFEGGICVTKHDPVYNHTYCHNYGGKLDHTLCEGEKCSCCIAPLCSKGEVFVADIENTLSYALRNTIPFKVDSSILRTFNDASRSALNAFLNITIYYLTSPQYIHEHTSGFIQEIYYKIKDKVYTSSSLIWELITVQNTNNFISPDFQPSVSCCKPGSKHFWRYTCGLWNILHTLTHAAKAQNANPPIEVLDVIHNYVINFQGCSGCEGHFKVTYKQTIAKYNNIHTHDDAILWLWCTHNAVNHRYTVTYGGESNNFPLIGNAWPPHPQFPLPSDCKNCWPAKSTNDTTNCNKLFCKDTANGIGTCFQTPDDTSDLVYHNFSKNDVLNHLKTKYKGPYSRLNSHQTSQPLNMSDFGKRD